MKQPTKAQKLLALVMFLPELSDYIEDLKEDNVFKHRLAQKINMALAEMRIADRRLYERVDIGKDLSAEELDEIVMGIWNQQNDARELFRNFIIENLDESFVHSHS